MEIPNKLIAQGWRPLRFTGNDLQDDMNECLNQIASLLGKPL